MSDGIKRSIVAGLHEFAWSNARLDEATHLVLAYCYRGCFFFVFIWFDRRRGWLLDLPLAVRVPPQADGSRSKIVAVSFAPQLALVFVTSRSSEIFVFTEDLILIGSILPTHYGGITGHVAFDPTNRVLMAISNSPPPHHAIAIGFDGLRRPAFDLPRMHCVRAIRVDPTGSVYTIERRDASGDWLTHKTRSIHLGRVEKFAIHALNSGVYVATRQRGEDEWEATIYDSDLLELTSWPLGDSTRSLGFDEQNKLLFVQRGPNCAVHALDLTNKVLFGCPTVYMGQESELRGVPIVSWGGHVLWHAYEDQLDFAPIVLSPAARPATALSHNDMIVK